MPEIKTSLISLPRSQIESQPWLRIRFCDYLNYGEHWTILHAIVTEICNAKYFLSMYRAY